MKSPENARPDPELGKMLHKYNTSRPAIGALLEQEPDRFQRFSARSCGLLLDYTRCALSEDARGLLLDLARRSGVEGQRERMFAGEAINFTENRAVLHRVWRDREFDSVFPQDQAQALRSAVRRMGEIAAALRAGRLPDGGQGVISDVVHIGIGGSLLGPRLLVDAFNMVAGDAAKSVPRIHFLSSVDPGPREALLRSLDPATTAIIVVSKSFTTAEVMTHARSLFDWQEEALADAEVARRRFGVTSRPDKAAAWSIPTAHLLEMGEWTGGRYSLWSPVGLTAAIVMGPEAFDRLLEGGAAMDRHFRAEPLESNLPVMAAMLDVWHRNFCGYADLAVIPYDSRLGELPGWLQQVAMESNGKRTRTAGTAVEMDTSQVIFGDCGTDAQHSFFQAFHQGTSVVPVDFVGIAESGHADTEAKARLLSHMLAQATALARGRTLGEVETAMRKEGAGEEEIARLARHRVMPGNRPSTIIMLDEFSPETLGALLVFYEHRVFVQSVIWDINAFDQWGVELGKNLADAIEPSVADPAQPTPDGLPELKGMLAHIHSKQGS